MLGASEAGFNWLVRMFPPFGYLNLSSKIKLKTLYILWKSTAGLDAPDGLHKPTATTKTIAGNTYF